MNLNIEFKEGFKKLYDCTKKVIKHSVINYNVIVKISALNQLLSQ